MDKKISIIIPTYNEEKYIEKTLKSIKRQTYKNYEIIVSDNHSTDKTRSIAKKYGAIITDGGMPSEGRNNGAKVAKGEYFLFLDADTIIPRDFLKNAFTEAIERKLDAFTPDIELSSTNIANKIVWELTKITVRLNQYTKKPFSMGASMCIRKTVFDRVKGFDEKILFAEDTDIMRKIVKNKYKFRVINSTYSTTSDRRFAREGFGLAIIKNLYLITYKEFFGPIKKLVFKYDYGNYSNIEKLSIFAKLRSISNKLKIQKFDRKEIVKQISSILKK